MPGPTWPRSCSPAPISAPRRCPGCGSRRPGARPTPSRSGGAPRGPTGSPAACWTRWRSTRRTPTATPRPSIRRRRAATRSWRSPTTCRCAGEASGCRWAGWWTPCPRSSGRARPGERLRSGTVSLVPSNLRFNSTLSRDWAEQQSFSVPISRPTDNSVRPALALTHLWRNSAGFTWQPIGLINLASDVTSTRDLRVYPDSTSLGRLAYNEREFLLGHSGGGRAGPGGDHLALQHAAGHLLAGTADPLGQQLRALPEPHLARPGAGRRGQRRLHPSPDAEQPAELGDRVHLRPAPPAARHDRRFERNRQGAGTGAPVRPEPAGAADLDLRPGRVQSQPELHAGARRAGELPGAGRAPTPWDPASPGPRTSPRAPTCRTGSAAR